MDEYSVDYTPLCQRSSKNMNFFVNSILHVFILLVIISAFFFLYVSNLSKQKFKEELKDVVDENLMPAIKSADTNGYIKKVVQNMNIDQIIQYYDTPNETTTIQNNWLLYISVLIIAMIAITITIVMVILKIFCYKLPIGNIIKENIVMFSLVGLVEVLFFLYIARNYVPTKPSLVVNTVIDKLKSNF